MSETKRKNFTGDFKAKVALEAIRGIKTVNEIGQERCSMRQTKPRCRRFARANCTLPKSCQVVVPFWNNIRSIPTPRSSNYSSWTGGLVRRYCVGHVFNCFHRDLAFAGRNR